MGLLSNVREALGFGGVAPSITPGVNFVKAAPGTSKALVRANQPYLYNRVDVLPKTKTERLYDSYDDSLRAYEAALPTNTQSDWQAWLVTGNFDIFNWSRRLRALTRNLEENNPFVKGYLRDLTSNVIGFNGLRLTSKVPNQKGAKLNAKLNAAVHDAWKDFRKKQTYEMRGIFSGIELDRQILRRLAVDGEVLIKLVRGKTAGNKFNFAIQVLECDYLNIWNNQSLQNGAQNRVVMGVEQDNYGKPTAYWMLDFAQQDLFAEQVQFKQNRISADQIIHIYLPDRFSQCRGVSWLAPVASKLRTLERFEENVAIARRLTASKMAQMVTTVKDADEYEGQGRGPAGEIIEEFSPGIVPNLPYGKELKAIDPGVESESFSDFRKQLLRSIATGFGCSYNILANDMESVNYSSARVFKDVEIEYWRELQRFYKEHILQSIFDAWVPYAVLSGQIEAASPTQIDDIIKYSEWHGRGWAYINPVQEITSSLNAISGGLSSRRRELYDMGIDYEEFLDEVAADQELEKEKGVTFVNPAIKNLGMAPSPDAPEDPGEVADNDPNNDGSGKTQSTPAAIKKTAKPVKKVANS